MARPPQKAHYLGEGDRPPVKAPVEIVDSLPNTGAYERRYVSRIMFREGASDYLDALKAPDGSVVRDLSLLSQHVYLLWGNEDELVSFRILIENILDPIPALQVRYIEPPRRHNRRLEWRSNTKIHGTFTLLPDRADIAVRGGASQPFQPARKYYTMTRNIAYSALRFYSRHQLSVGTQLTATWHLHDGTIIRADMEIILTLPRISVYHGVEGRDVVARWDPPLASPLREVWHTFCDSHRYD